MATSAMSEADADDDFLSSDVGDSSFSAVFFDDIRRRERMMDRAHGEEEIDDDEDGGDEDEISENDDDDVGDDEEKEEEMKMKDEIVESFIRNFHNGNYDVELDDKLSSDRGTIIAARPTQASYNKPDDWRERNRLGLEEVRQQLQECIDIVSHSQSFHLCLTHPINQQLIDDEEPIVWHEPILDEYWDQFEEEIARKKQLGILTEICYIGIMNVEMKKERLAALLAIFRATNSSTDITFNNTNLCGEGIVWLSKLVDVSSQLQYLFLEHNRIDSTDSARCLSRSLKSHTGINHLHLCHCDLGSSPEILSVILQSDVNRISLDNNNIDSLGAVKIAEYLENNPPIDCIDLDHNHLNDDDAILISQALKRNTNLTAINLCSNNFTSIGVKALLTCAFDSSSLNAISESNHTLGRMNIFHEDNELEDCIDRLLELDRTDKIVLAQGISIEISCKCTRGTYARGVKIPSTGWQCASVQTSPLVLQAFESSVFNNAMVEHVYALLL